MISPSSKIWCQRLPTIKPPTTQAMGAEACAYNATKYDPHAKNAVVKISDSISCLPLKIRSVICPKNQPIIPATTISYNNTSTVVTMLKPLPCRPCKIVINSAIHTASLNSDSPSSLIIKWRGALIELSTPLMPIGSVAPSAAPNNSNTANGIFDPVSH